MENSKNWMQLRTAAKLRCALLVSVVLFDISIKLVYFVFTVIFPLLFLSDQQRSIQNTRPSFDSDDDSQPLPAYNKVTRNDSKRQIIIDDSEEEENDKPKEESGNINLFFTILSENGFKNATM